ncbi:MAG: F0F1 ATP synthase subunit B' [Pseudomonadota bacterium]
MGLLLKTTAAILIALPAFAADEEKKGGMPQLDTSTFGSQIFWLVVSIVALYFILRIVALPRIAGGLEERSDAIEDDLDRASEFRKKAEEAEAAYDKALADARGKAQEIAQKTRDEIQKNLDMAIAKADAEIAARSAEGEKRIAEIQASALIAVEEVANDTAEALVEAVAPGAVDSQAIQSAVAGQVKG